MAGLRPPSFTSLLYYIQFGSLLPPVPRWDMAGRGAFHHSYSPFLIRFTLWIAGRRVVEDVLKVVLRTRAARQKISPSQAFFSPFLAHIAA